MDTFEVFNNGKLVLPEREACFAEIGWSKHATFEGVELKHIITAKDTEGKFSCHLVRIAPDCTNRKNRLGRLFAFNAGLSGFL